MKRFIGLLFALAVMVGIPVSSLAYTARPIEDFSFLFQDGRLIPYPSISEHYILHLPDSMVKESDFSKWESFLSTLDDPDYKYIVRLQAKVGEFTGEFISIPKDSVITWKKASSGDSIGFSSSLSFNRLSFNLVFNVSTGEVTSSNVSVYLNSAALDWYKSPLFTSSIQHFWWTSHDPYPETGSDAEKYIICSDVAGLVLITDEELPEPSDPDPPESSEPPVTPPGPPDIPAGGEYVPYDTSAWGNFYEYVRATIGNTVPIGFLILGLILGIYLMIRIVKMFTRV